MSRPTFLDGDAARDDLLRAVASNHRQSWIAGARRAGGEAHRKGGIPWIVTPGTEGGAGEIVFAFPRSDGPAAGARIDAILRDARSRPYPVRSLSCWALEEDRSRALGARLAARGFEWGWQPHWMHIDLENLRADFAVPDGLRIKTAEPDEVWDVEDDLPYYSREAAPDGGNIARTRRRRAWRFGAWLDGKIVGQSNLFLTTGRLGVAGIYGCGVVPSARNKGIGAAVTAAACRFAREMGCRHALLNATFLGERMYPKIGFVSMGKGQTWWLHRERLEAPPPTDTEITFAEAVGLGDLAVLDALGSRVDVEAALLCGMRPMELAVATQQPASAEWLAGHGATLDVASAWALGWKERIPDLLRGRPELANRRSGPDGATPLHGAAWYDNQELIQMLLDGGADPALTDTTHGSTPAGWARHSGNVAAAEMIEERMKHARSLS